MQDWADGSDVTTAEFRGLPPVPAWSFRIAAAASEEQEFVKTSNIINFKQLRADQVRTQIKSEFLH